MQKTCVVQFKDLSTHVLCLDNPLIEELENSRFIDEVMRGYKEKDEEGNVKEIIRVMVIEK